MKKDLPSLFVEEYSEEFSPGGSKGQHYLLVPLDYCEECGLPDGNVFEIKIGRGRIRLQAWSDDGERQSEPESDPEYDEASGTWKLAFLTRIRSGGQHLIDTYYLDELIEGTSTGDEYRVSIKDEEILLTRARDF